MKTRLTVLCVSCLCLPLLASAQWKWLDASGHPVFSDMPPPAGIEPRNILKRPGMPSTPLLESSTNKTANISMQPRVAPAQPEDATLAAKVTQSKRAQDANRQADEARIAAAKADNCRRAQQAYITLNSGLRMRTVNDAGESVVMDEQARAAESQRLHGVMQTDCF
jgi:hypothetical protein